MVDGDSGQIHHVLQCSHQSKDVCWSSYNACMETEFTKYRRPGPEVIKLFSCSTQLSMKFNMLINVKMPTIVGILTFINMMNTKFKRMKARNVFIFQHFSFHKELKFHAQLSRL